jgi:outer membrane lipoprotein carrier protein
MRKLLLALVVLVGLAGAASDSLWQNLRARYLGLKTLSGTFTENICSDEKGTCTSFEGKFAISLPAQYRLEVTKSVKQLFVSDSANLWIYLPDAKRIIKRPGGGFAPILAFLGPVLDSTATGDVSKDSTGIYVVKVSMDEEMSALHDLALELDETGTRIDGFSFNDGTGNEMHFRFSDQKWNPRLSPELFKFTVPEGMTVEEQ